MKRCAALINETSSTRWCQRGRARAKSKHNGHKSNLIYTVNWLFYAVWYVSLSELQLEACNDSLYLIIDLRFRKSQPDWPPPIIIKAQKHRIVKNNEWSCESQRLANASTLDGARWRIKKASFSWFIKILLQSGQSTSKVKYSIEYFLAKCTPSACYVS